MSRRSALTGMAALSAGAALGGCAPTLAGLPGGITDADILNFALNLEYLEAEYYALGTTGRSLGLGQVNGGRAVPFRTSAFRQFAEEVTRDEVAHVKFLRGALGASAVPPPPIDFTNAFDAAGQAAGLGAGFDPFADETSFFLGAFLFEDVGVTAYNGAAPLITSKAILEQAAGILAVEAYHGGMVRSQIMSMGQGPSQATEAISNARDSLDGSADLDQGVITGNFAPLDPDAKAFARLPQQVLNIVYLTPERGVSAGGFFPQGVNGTLRTT
jgi:hypothetical protein